MEKIRAAINNNCLDEEENEWLVEDLKYYNRKTMNISADK